MPSAHPPQRNSTGDIVGSWLVTVRYDEVTDKVYVTRTAPGGLWRKARTWSDTFAPVDLEDAIAAVQVSVRTLGARRLF